MITTTLKKLRESRACINGYNKLVCTLLDEPFAPCRETYIRFDHKDEISIEYILDSNGLDDALWSLRASNASDRDMRLYAVWCARQVEHLMYDQRSLDALIVAERHANGLASDGELAAAWAAAWDASRAAAWDAAWDAAWAAAWDAAWDASRAASRAAAWAASRAASRAAARAAAWDAQSDMLRKMSRGEAPWQ